MRSFLVAAILTKLVIALPTGEPDDNVTVYKRAPPMSFACDELPDICTSMCWGAYCTEPSFGVTLEFDNPDESKKSDRRTSAGCQPRPNRCSVNHDPPYPDTGFNCDEYPFASTSDADKGGQTNRCVPRSQNSAQGNVIKNYISGTCGCQPCQFIVGFGNPASAGVKYCDAYEDRHNRCVPDDNTYKGQNPDVQPPAEDEAKKRGLGTKTRGGLYVTKRGMEVSFAEELEPGTAIKHARARRTPLPLATRALLEARQECDPGDGDEFDTEDAMRKRSGKALKSRITAADALGGPDHEFIDDEIAYKVV